MDSAESFDIRRARSKPELTATAALFRAYSQSLAIDISYQGFEQELAALPGLYSPPGGELILAKRGDHVLGCIALRPLEPPRIAEIKRLYVRSQVRRIGVGLALVMAAEDAARTLGYTEIRLDTLPGMEEAVALCKRAGCAPIAPSGGHPYPGLVTLGKALR
ncbi:MAG TPA: GNAT family N-acetyltransferase [Rhizomicrobium sp.]|jgi:GNAT superfamily N-acetyltransferase